MSLILIILSIIGAIPDIIAAVEAIWALIQQVRHRPTRLAMTKKLRRMVLGHLSPDQKSIRSDGACLSDLCEFEAEVKAALAAEAS